VFEYWNPGARLRRPVLSAALLYPRAAVLSGPIFFLSKIARINTIGTTGLTTTPLPTSPHAAVVLLVDDTYKVAFPHDIR